MWQNGCISHTWVARVVWQACLCMGVCGYYTVFNRKPKFPAATPPLPTYTRTIEWPPFSRWYLIQYWPVLGGLCATSTQVQRGFSPRPQESGTWTTMKGLLYLSRRRGSIYVTGASPASWRVWLNGGGSVCGFFAVALLIPKGKIHLYDLHWEVRI